MLNSKSRKPVKKQEISKKLLTQLLLNSIEDLLKERLNSMISMESNKTKLQISRITWMRFKDSKVNLLMIQEIQPCNKNYKPLKVKLKV